MNRSIHSLHDYGAIRAGIVDLLEAARAASARSINAVMTATYWEIGRRIVEEEQKGAARAKYGDALIRQLATDLSAQFGRGFGVVNLSQMKRFFLTWPDKGIFQTPSEKSSKSHSISNIQKHASAILAVADHFPLPWSAYVRLLTVKRPEARMFYETEALRSGWSVRQLDRQIA